MTEIAIALAIATVALPLAACIAIVLCRSPLVAGYVNQGFALLVGGTALALAVLALTHSDETEQRGIVLVDAAGCSFLAVIALVGLVSALVSPSYLHERDTGFFRARHAHRWYYLSFYLFWAALLAIPLAGNLGIAWLLIEATTGASALLVAYSGTRSALEAGWKYLVLTTIGLTVALLGIVILFVLVAPSGGGLRALDWSSLEGAADSVSGQGALIAFLLVLVGLATKVGWAPVHNWLPDAHSEAPPPVSALLSAALLPAIVLVAWRLKTALGPAVGPETTQAVFFGFALISLAVAVPFLWRPLAWKRLLAYSSLEHMGVLALGIGIGHPLAIAGVVLHLFGHALAKSLGFYAATPLIRIQRTAAGRPPRGVARTSPAVAGAMGVSLVSLSGLPPSPLFFSEVFILLGGFLAGNAAVAAFATLFLALGFLGLIHALIEGLFGRALGRRRDEKHDTRQIRVLTVGLGVGLLALSALAYALPGSDLVEALSQWAS